MHKKVYVEPSLVCLDVLAEKTPRTTLDRYWLKEARCRMVSILALNIY